MNVVSLFKKVGNPKFSSVKDMLDIIQAKNVAGNYGSNPAMMVLIQDRDSGDYKTLYESCGLTSEKAVALLEVTKFRIMQQKMES